MLSHLMRKHSHRQCATHLQNTMQIFVYLFYERIPSATATTLQTENKNRWTRALCWCKKNVIHDDTRRVPYSPSTPPLPPHTQHAKCIEVDFEIRCDMISLFCSLLSPVPLRHPSDIWLWIVIFASLFTFPAHCCAIRFSNCTCFAMPRLGPIDWQLPIAVAKNENEHTTGWRKCFECRKITRAQIGFVPQSNGIRHIFIFIPNFATPILEQTKINRFPLWDRERDERRKRIGLSFLSAIRLHCSNRHVFLLAASTYPRLMFAPMRWIQLLFAFQY